MYLDRRVLAAHAIDKVGNHVDRHDIFDDCEKSCFLFRFHFIGALQDIVHAQVVLVNFEYFDKGRL